MITSAQAFGGMKDLLRFGRWTQEERMISSQCYSSVFTQTQNWLLSFTGTLLQQQGLLGLFHAWGTSVEHTKGHDCTGHQVSAHVGCFIVCSPGFSQLLSGMGLALTWMWEGKTLLLLEKRQEDLAEKTRTEGVRLRILLSAFSHGKKQLGLCCFLFVTW